MSSITIITVKNIFAKVFTFIFFSLAAAIIFSIFNTIYQGIINGADIMQIFLSSINTSIIALAVFELALVINQEYTNRAESEDVIASIRRTIPRFIGTVCIALAIEGLIMVIKYSQLDLAGNLYYPVAIITSTAVLLASLGLFLHLTKNQDS
tara:strand:+ start:1224 stop:1679 length:456 start_codon:yes stop_codon:yes gene_type:complete